MLGLLWLESPLRKDDLLVWLSTPEGKAYVCQASAHLLPPTPEHLPLLFQQLLMPVSRGDFGGALGICRQQASTLALLEHRHIIKETTSSSRGPKISLTATFRANLRLALTGGCVTHLNLGQGAHSGR